MSRSDATAHDEVLYELPTACPVTGGPLYISELTSVDGGVTIRGKFRVPPASRLDPEQRALLDVFLRSRGVISTMEKELGLSYPTVRSRIDAMLGSMGLKPIKASTRSRTKVEQDRRKILEELEAGSITPDEAKARLKSSGGSSS